MNKNKYLALTAAGFFLAGCAGMTKNQAALVGASVCGAMGAGVGAAVAHNGIDGEHRNEGIGAGIGLVSGALICGGLAYLIAQDPKPAATTTTTSATTATATSSAGKTEAGSPTATAAAPSTTRTESGADDHTGRRAF